MAACESVIVTKQKGRRPQEKVCGKIGITYEVSLPAVDSIVSTGKETWRRGFPQSPACRQVLCPQHRRKAIEEGKMVVPATAAVPVTATVREGVDEAGQVHRPASTGGGSQ